MTMSDQTMISTSLLGRAVRVDEGWTMHSHEGECVGIHKHGCDYTVLVLHGNGKVCAYPLSKITVAREGDT